MKLEQSFDEDNLRKENMTSKENIIFLEKYIPSADMKNKIIETGHVFSDWDKAAIIWNSDLPLEAKTSDLKIISDTTDDMILHKQIKERLAYDQESENVFIENNEGFVFELRIVNGEFEGESIGFYKNYQVAFQKGISRKSDFYITKHQVIDEQTVIIKPWVNTASFIEQEAAEQLTLQLQEMSDSGMAVSEFYYNETGELLSYYTYELPKERDISVNALNNKRFEYKFVPFPNPFKYEEEVKLVRAGCADFKYGAWVDDKEENWEALINRAEQENAIEDYSDANLRVKVWNGDTLSWDHEHISPIYLESVKDEKGESSEKILEIGRMFCDKYSFAFEELAK